MGYHVLMVCTGNICRSPMAKVILESRLPDAMKAFVRVETAGVNALDGESATDQAVQVMAERGLDLSGHAAGFLSYERMKESDLILVMEKDHLKHIQLFYRPAKDKAHLLREFGVRRKSGDVPDPYGKSLRTYRACADLIESCMNGVIAHIEKTYIDPSGE